MEDFICCPKCEGKGKLSLYEAAEHLDATLFLVRKFGPITATQLHGKLGNNIRVTAVMNRLEVLRSLGFVARKKSNRNWFYRAVEKEGAE